jgi:hypothetical protein
MPPRATTLIIACAASAVAHPAQAIGFGRLEASAVLGQTLNLPVPVHAEPGERMVPECVSAEVTVGDVQLARDRVRVRLEPSTSPSATSGDWIARVQTTTVIDEPVLDITLHVGCGQGFSRRFMALADPPGTSLPRARSPEVPRAGAVPLPDESGGLPTTAKSAAPPSAGSRPSGRHASAPGARPAQGHAPVRQSRAHAEAAKAPRQSTAGSSRLLLDAEGPRLRLDLEDPLFTAPAVATAGDARASAPADQVLPDADRLPALEKSLADMRQQSQVARDAADALRLRLTEAEQRSRAVPWLASLLALALGVAAWLALRLRREQDAAAEAPNWWTPEVTAGSPPDEDDLGPVEPPPPSNLGDLVDAPSPAPTAPLPMALSIEREASASRAAEPPMVEARLTEPVSRYERTTAMPGPSPFLVQDAAVAEPSMVREVSIEELLDLEQQADFFIALGQEDAAIDLLMSHLRSTGGLSPLPYTKLLEIFRRQGDREAFERIRARFNRRFNAYAPDWDAGPMSGRSLEDYADVVQHLQSLWPQPLDAMAMLEAMLFRKDAAQELFDLPAYNDVLLLYSIARDLWQQGGGRVPDIDVLLPLDDTLAAALFPAAVEPIDAPEAFVLPAPGDGEPNDPGDGGSPR